MNRLRGSLVVLLACGLLLMACDSSDWEDWEYEDEGESSGSEPATPAGETVSPLIDTPLPGERVQMHKWDLWAGGETLLRGANIWQRRVYPELDGPEFMGPGPIGPPFSQEDLNQMAEAGANFVNISHPGLFTEAPPYEVDPEIEANLDNLLAMIEQADMFAVISFRTGPERAEFTFVLEDVGDWFDASYLNDSVWEDQAAQAAWDDMWQYAAGRYHDHPVVVGYDLMVEPNANEVFFEVYEPEEFYPAQAGTTYDWNQFYPHVAAAIREVDPDTPILVGGLGYSAVEWLPYLEPVDLPYMVYMVHQYAPFEYTHQVPGLFGGLKVEYPGEYDFDYDGEPEPFDAAWLDDLLTPVDAFMLEHDAPVGVNEFGPMRFEPGVVGYMDDLIAQFELRGMNHAFWEWGTSYSAQREEPQPFDIRLGTDLDNRSEDVPSDLLDVIKGYWARNTLRPSLVEFLPGE